MKNLIDASRRDFSQYKMRVSNDEKSPDWRSLFPARCDRVGRRVFKKSRKKCICGQSDQPYDYMNVKPTLLVRALPPIGA
jgi:hypothetical protein